MNKIRYDHIEGRTLTHFCYFSNQIIDNAEKTLHPDDCESLSPNNNYLAEQLYCEWRFE